MTSLADQRDQWITARVKVSVLRARGLRVKAGRSGAHALLQVGPQRFGTRAAEGPVRAEPVWAGQEAAFELTGFPERGAVLRVQVLQNALVGPDKLLGQADVDLVQLYRDRNRDTTQWFKLEGKPGKPEKDRGHVQLEVQFLTGSLSSSMFDLSSQDTSHSKLAKLKDKLRGKKREGLSDSASAILPPVTQILTDSEGEEEEEEGKKKKKNKLKSLFTPKSSLQRNMSQSMSTLSPSSAPSLDSPHGKKKLKFLTHKRNSSSDSKTSQSSFINIDNQQPHTTTPTSTQSISSIQSTQSITSITSISPPHSLSSSGLGSLEELRPDEEEREVEEEKRGMRMEKEEEEQRRQIKEAQKRKEREKEEEMRKMEEEMRRIQAEEERQRQEKEMEEEKRRREVEEEERRRKIQVEEERQRQERAEEEKRRKTEEEKEKMRMEKEKEEQRRKIEEEKKRMRLEKEKEEMRRKLEEERKEREAEERRKMEEDRKRKEREEEERRKIEEEQVKIRVEREKEEMRRSTEEERKRKREEEEERRRIEEEKERIRIEKEKEEQRRKMEEERLEEEERRTAEEKRRRRMDEEEERLREEEKRKMEEERRRRVEEEERREEEKRVREEEERRKKEEQEREKQRVEEERLRKEEKRKMEEEKERIRVEKEKKEQKIKMEEEEKRRIAEETRRRMEEEESLREEEKRKMEEERKRRVDEERAEKVRKEDEKIKKEERKKKEEKEKMEEERKRRVDEKEREKQEREEEKRMREEMEEEEKDEQMKQNISPVQSARLSSVKPSSSASSVINTNPFLDEEDTVDDIFENLVSERSRVKKGRAPLPPQNKPDTQDFTNREILKRPAPPAPPQNQSRGHLNLNQRPPEASRVPHISREELKAWCVQSMKTRQGLNSPQKSDPNNNPNVLNPQMSQIRQSQSKQINTDISTSAGPAKHNKGPAPAKPSDLNQSKQKTDLINQSLTKSNAHPEDKEEAAQNSKSKHLDLNAEDESKFLKPEDTKTEAKLTDLNQSKQKSKSDLLDQRPKLDQSLTESNAVVKDSDLNADDESKFLKPEDTKTEAKPSASNQPNQKSKSDLLNQSLTKSNGHPEDEEDASQNSKSKDNFNNSDLNTEEDTKTEALPKEEETSDSLIKMNESESLILNPEHLVFKSDKLQESLSSESGEARKKPRAPQPPTKPRRAGDHQTSDHQSSDRQRSDHQTSNQTSNDHLSDHHQTSNHLSSHQTSKHLSSHQTSDHLSSDHQPSKCQLSNDQTANHQTSDVGSGSGLKLLPCARVGPTDVQISSGEVRRVGEAPPTLLRPHTVKPLNTADQQLNTTQHQTQSAEGVCKGPYAELTRAELVSLLVQQQELISQRDCRISELEIYIDKLLVRVMEEQPSILMSIT